MRGFRPAVRRSPGRIVAATLVMSALLAACGDDSSDGSSSPRFIEGDCLATELSADLTADDAVSCDENHLYEVIGSFETDGEEYPGQAELDTQGQTTCSGTIFEDYIGIPEAEAIYTVFTLVPSEEQWDAGDHTTICFARNGNDPDDGTIRGAADGARGEKNYSP